MQDVKELIERLKNRRLWSADSKRLESNDLDRFAATALEALSAENERMFNAIEQALDDMDEKGLCVCQATKDMLRGAAPSALQQKA